MAQPVARVDVLGLGLLGRCGRALARQLQGQLNGERGALALGALHGNSAVHHVHEVLRDGHAEPGALDAADGGGALALEGVEDVLDEFGAHANTRVRHGEAVAPVADWRAGQLVQRHLDESVGIRELQGVAQQVQENLVDAQLVAAHLGVADALGVDGEVQLPRARLGLNDAVEIVQKIDEVVGLLIQ